jgi:hypothetical protein
MNLESGRPLNLENEIGMARRSAAVALPAVSALRRVHSDSAMRIVSWQVSSLG